MAYNKKAHLQTNIEAIRIAFTLDKEKRRATEAEHAILKQYSGFGGIKCILNPIQDKACWTKSEIDLLPMVSDLHQLIRENSRDENEYKHYFNSLKSSILTAFYTPPEIIKTLSDALKENGVAPVRFLEPSAGNGAFADAFKQTFPNNETVCFEKDLLTGKILSHLHPDSKVHVRGFEEIENRPDNRFDVIASNIPFGDTAVFDISFATSKDLIKRQATRAVHNYFFLKGVDTLHEGGMLAFITSQGVMNSPGNEPVRKWLMNNTNLISAVLVKSHYIIKPQRLHYSSLEVDEFWTHVGKKKNKVWLIYAYDRESGEIVSFVWGKRDLKTAQKLRKKLIAAGITYDRICTDNRESFVIAFQQDNHVIGKYHTVGIEGNNCRLRHRIRHTFRKTCCFSKIIRNHLRNYYQIN
jgi:IS1 family transposase